MRLVVRVPQALKCDFLPAESTNQNLTSTHRRHNRNFTSACNLRRQAVNVPDILIANEDVDVLSNLALFRSDAVTQTWVNGP